MTDSKPGWGIQPNEKLHVSIIKAGIQMGALALVFYGIYCANELAHKYLDMQAAAETRRQVLIGSEISRLREAVERSTGMMKWVEVDEN